MNDMKNDIKTLKNGFLRSDVVARKMTKRLLRDKLYNMVNTAFKADAFFFKYFSHHLQLLKIPLYVVVEVGLDLLDDSSTSGSGLGRILQGGARGIERHEDRRDFIDLRHKTVAKLNFLHTKIYIEVLKDIFALEAGVSHVYGKMILIFQNIF